MQSSNQNPVKVYTFGDDRCLCLHLQSSTSSEMKDLSFAHLNHFSHRHFPEARHDFASSPDFLITAAKDIADEAFGQAFAKDYVAKHPQPPQYTVCSKPDQTAPSLAAMTTGKRTIRMPKHFFLSPEYTSSMDHGDTFLLQGHTPYSYSLVYCCNSP